MPNQGEPIPAAEVRARIDDILDRSEFDTSPAMIEEIVAWLMETFGIGDAAEGVMEGLLWTVGAILLGLLVWFVVRLILAHQGRIGEEGGGAPPLPGPTARQRAEALRLRARAAREAGDLRLALRLSFFALVVGLGARGNLRYRDAWTNRELLDRGRPAPATRSLLFPLVQEFEAKDFGSVPTAAADVDRVEALCEEYLGPLAEGEA